MAHTRSHRRPPQRCGVRSALDHCIPYARRRFVGGLSSLVALLLVTACAGERSQPLVSEGGGSAANSSQAEADRLQAPQSKPDSEVSGEGTSASTGLPASSGDPISATEAPAPSPTLDALRLALEPLAGGFDDPLLVTHAGDGSSGLYVVEQAGRIRLIDPDEPGDAPRLVLDIRGRIQSRGSEQGLLGLAFHPEFARNRRLFVNYSASETNGGTVISEFRADASGDIDPGSERRILAIEQPAANHNGGHLAFGPDGYLYIATGDGGGADDRYGNGQRTDSLLGKILRIDIDAISDDAAYGIPADNPFVGRGEFRPEIFAWGLRNPWRFSFDRQDAALYIGDVGQNRWEEIDRIEAGDPSGPNLGWPLFEGFACFKSQADCLTAQAETFMAPILAYSHEDGPGCSVTGGFVVRPEGAGQAGAGTYLYADYCSGRIWGALQGADGRWTSALLLESGLAVSSFGEGEDGSLYLCDHREGKIYRIVLEDGTEAPADR